MTLYSSDGACATTVTATVDTGWRVRRVVSDHGVVWTELFVRLLRFFGLLLCVVVGRFVLAAGAG